jgi:hypothetical protein
MSATHRIAKLYDLHHAQAQVFCSASWKRENAKNLHFLHWHFHCHLNSLRKEKYYHNVVWLGLELADEFSFCIYTLKTCYIFYIQVLPSLKKG